MTQQELGMLAAQFLLAGVATLCFATRFAAPRKTQTLQYQHHI